jgi:hypothetical protein
MHPLIESLLRKCETNYNKSYGYISYNLSFTFGHTDFLCINVIQICVICISSNFYNRSDGQAKKPSGDFRFSCCTDFTVALIIVSYNSL